MSEVEIRQVLGLLYQDDTLRVLASLVLHGTEEGCGLDPDATRRALERLERGGLAVRSDDGWNARRERFRELLHATAKPVAPASAEDRVVQNFLVDGRLRTMPSRREKRLVVLSHIARIFEPGVRYPEKDVDIALRAFHDDYVALRRYLVEEDLMSRENNVYWRSGGPVET